MIIGIGTDIIEIARIEKLLKKNGQKFVDKIFNVSEQIELGSPKSAAHYAKRFAAKEAIAKALGTGIGKISFKDIEIFNDENGKPHAKIKNSNFSVHLSLADEKSHAIAFAVVES